MRFKRNKRAGEPAQEELSEKLAPPPPNGQADSPDSFANGESDVEREERSPAAIDASLAAQLTSEQPPHAVASPAGVASGAPAELVSDVEEEAVPQEHRRRSLLPRRRVRAADDAVQDSKVGADGEPDLDPLDVPWLLDPDDEDTPAVDCAEVVKRFGEGETSVLALSDISLQFAPHTFSAIMGRSGSGKSTLMHLLAGLDTPTSGTVRIGGVALDGLSERRRTALRRARVGFVFQAFNLLPVLSAQENIELPLRVAGARPDPYWVQELLRAFDLLDRRDHRPAELSGGQQQRVAIARALVTQPNVVFADEPTGNIDSAAGEEVLGILETCVREYGQTVVMVTHDPLAAAHAERVVFLADGRIVRDEQALSTRQILDVLRERS